jgi:hypothetical protein
VFPVVLFQSFSSAVVTYKVSITHMNTSHHRIIVHYLGLLDILPSNSILNQLLVMSDAHKTDVFSVFPLYNHQFVIVNCHTFSFSKFAYFISSGTPYFDAVFPWHHVSLLHSLLYRLGPENQLSWSHDIPH